MVFLRFSRKCYFHKYVVKTFIDASLFAAMVLSASIMLPEIKWIAGFITLVSFAASFFIGYKNVPYLFQITVLNENEIRAGNTVFQWNEISSVVEENKYAIYHFNLVLMVEYPLGRYYVVKLTDDRNISHELLIPAHQELKTLIVKKLGIGKIETNPTPDYLHPVPKKWSKSSWGYVFICSFFILLCIIDSSAWKVFVFGCLLTNCIYRSNLEYYKYKYRC